MPKPFDAATKHLLEAQPSAWLDYLGLPGTHAQLVEADLTTVTAEADKVLRVDDTVPYLAHIEFQSGYETDLGERVLHYNVLLFYRHRLPVQSVVVLLRREADGPEVTGTAGYDLESGSLAFRCRVVRVWEKSPEEALDGGLATLPLAPLGNVAREALPDVVRRMEERIEREATPGEAGTLWTATYLLLGLKYERGFVRQLLKGIRGMRESTTYQEILEEGASIGEARGKAEEARGLIFRLGSKRFGSPDAQTQATLDAVTSLERLELLAERLLEAESWAELLA